MSVAMTKWYRKFFRTDRTCLRYFFHKDIIT
jgi:hypothetical protein